MGPASRTYLLVDGENLDATLGNHILNRKPLPDERPRWDRLLRYLQDHWRQPVTGLFFFNAAGGEVPYPFVQALAGIGYRPILLSGRPDQKVVDLGIQRTLEALASRAGDVALASHDGEFLPFLEPLADSRRIALIGFVEFMSGGFRSLIDDGAELLDLERDICAFKSPLPRIRVIPVDEFDPLEFL